MANNPPKSAPKSAPTQRANTEGGATQRQPTNQPDNQAQGNTQDTGSDVDRDAIVLPEFERRLSDAHATADVDTIESTQAEYTKARAKELKRRNSKGDK